MKKLIIFFLLILSVSSFGASLTETLLKYYDTGYPDLTYGIEIPVKQNLMDFSKPFITNTDYKIESFKINSENNIYVGFSTDKFYNLDFAEDPFDGIIEVMVMGEPSASTNLTLLIAGLLGLAMFMYKKKYMPA